MPFVVNPFSNPDPLSTAISNLGNTVFGNTGQADLRRQQLLALQRGNVETNNLGKAVAANPKGAAGVLATPVGQAMALSAGYDPKSFAALALGGTANADGAAAPATQAAQIGAGESYDNTAAATNAKLANAAQIAGNEPIAALTPTGAPTFISKSAAVAPGNTFAPVLTDAQEKGALIGTNWNNLPALNANQQAVIGAARAPGAVQTPHNYVAPGGVTHITYDGITDAQTGQLLPPGGFIANAQGTASEVGVAPTNAVKSDVQKSIIAQNQFSGLADAMIGLTNAHPEAFGAYGKVAGGVQEIGQAGQVLVNQLGGPQTYANLVNGARNALEASGASSDIVSQFDPAIPAVDTLGPVLAASAANAVAQQTGRSLSDQDYKLFLGIIGDPQGWLSSAVGVRTRLQILKAAVGYSGQMAQTYLNKGLAPPDGLAAAALAKAVADVANSNQPASAPAAAPSVTSPMSPAQAQPTAPTAPVQIKSAADYAALPPGAHYIDPNGVARVKAR